MNRERAKVVKLILKTFIILFLSLGSVEAETLKEIHEGCTICHVEEDLKAIKTGINETCLKCHPKGTGQDHPIGVVSKSVPEVLPLDKENKVTCITCHDPHTKDKANKLLRMEFNNLCLSCHRE